MGQYQGNIKRRCRATVTNSLDDIELRFVTGVLSLCTCWIEAHISNGHLHHKPPTEIPSVGVAPGTT